MKPKLAGFGVVFAVCALCVGSAELGARVFWYVRFRVSPFHPSHILYAYYPELRRADLDRPSSDDDTYDILMLGASTINPQWGTVEQELREQLATAGLRSVRIFNLSAPAHTSRDDVLKYRALRDVRFDLVILYDGFNEVRANNAPVDVYRKDYSHYSWYETVNALARYHKASSFALPYTVRILPIWVRQVFQDDRYVPTRAPRADWVQYGHLLRSADSLEKNLGEILDLARSRSDRMLLATLATYLPTNYTPQGFAAKTLDYVLHLFPVEAWGSVENVRAGVNAHNEVIRRLAASHSEVLFVDEARLMPAVPSYFNDVCHFTTVGSADFVRHVMAALLPKLEKTRWIRQRAESP